MHSIINKLLLLVLIINAWSCIREPLTDCGVMLEFVFEHNMEFKDMFDPHVSTVTVYVFDDRGKFMFSKTAHRQQDLAGGNKMILTTDLAVGTYRVLTVGGLQEPFRFRDTDDQPLCPGITDIGQVRLALYRESDEVAGELSHLWFGEAVVIQKRTEPTLWTVNLIRNTNHFRITLRDADGASIRSSSGEYTFAIDTPEGACYGPDNTPVWREAVSYKPFRLVTRGNPDEIAAGDIHTMRLFADDPTGYQLHVKDLDTGEALWQHDLMKLLLKTKPSSRPDGSTLPFQEYLDRQGEWDVVIYHRQTGPGDGFLAVAIEVNGWMIRLSDIGI